ncbi:MAG TPA: antibiotic biosynthesis monooxygenase [Acidimicrobiales bacterium]|nr:antibiotic biosynthesis monooxygenase [Acidimicrobiales bacterium]
MSENEGIRLVIEFEVGDIDRFRAMAEAMVMYSKTEPGTLVYDWYLDEENARGKLYEAYVDNDAVVAHGMGPVFLEIAPKYLDCLTVTSVEVFGDASELAKGGDVLRAPTLWWGPAFAAVTD